MPEKSNENVRKMAELLRSGNTMLNRSCPVCNTPIFRNQEGDLFCPSCDREVKIVDDKSKMEEHKLSSSKSQEPTKEVETPDDLEGETRDIVDQTLTTLKAKIRSILTKIDSEDQTNQLREYLTILKDLYDLFFYVTKE
jgi:UPF0148 protein